jgi:ribonuclease HI
MACGYGGSTYAELFAIQLALHEICAVAAVRKIGVCRIVSDCEPAILLCTGGTQTKKAELVPILQNIKSFEESLPVLIQYQWVKSHSSHKYNNMADKIAYSMLSQ